tara:strand:- start:2843 stop:3286 length:444 start_codon:yes stop_codon:yes gene_type:complete
LNNALGEKALREKVLEKVFETYWPQFETGFQKALDENDPSEPSKPRSEESLLAEVLNTVRSMQHRLRNMESRSDTAINETHRPKPVRKRIRVSEIRSKIDDMISIEVPEPVIEKLMAADGVPIEVIRKHIKMIMDEKRTVNVGADED